MPYGRFLTGLRGHNSRGVRAHRHPCRATTADGRGASGPASGTVLITGSNRGLGLEFVKQYAARGWKVIATARDPGTATELRAIAAKNRNVTIDKLDVADVPAIKALAAKYKGTPIDVLINNAGVLGDMPKQALGSLDKKEFDARTTRAVVITRE